MSQEVVTVTLAEASAAEEATDARLNAAQFQPSGPLQAPPAAYDNAHEYNVGDTVTENGGAWRSIVHPNKGHVPHEDDGTHWQAFSYTLAAPLVNPDYFHTPSAGAGLGE